MATGEAARAGLERAAAVAALRGAAPAEAVGVLGRLLPHAAVAAAVCIGMGRKVIHTPPCKSIYLVMLYRKYTGLCGYDFTTHG